MTLIACQDCEREVSSLAVACPHCGRPIQGFGYEYRSKTTLFGLPLVHIVAGPDPLTRRPRVAVGIIAVGQVACGVLAIGGVAVGGVAVGGMGVGLLALGGMALGGVAFGGVAVGGLALGGLAIGWYALGGAALGVHAIDGRGGSPETVEAFRRLWPF